MRFPHQPTGVIRVSLGRAAAGLASPLNIEALVIEPVFSDVDTAIYNRVAARLGPLSGLPSEFLLSQLPPRLGIPRSALWSIDHIPQVSCPLLIASGMADLHTAAAETQNMFDIACEPKELWLVDGAAHVDLPNAAGVTYHHRIAGFLKRNCCTQDTLEKISPRGLPAAGSISSRTRSQNCGLSRVTPECLRNDLAHPRFSGNIGHPTPPPKETPEPPPGGLLMKCESIQGNSIFLIHDFLSPAECAQHVDRSEKIGFETFTIGGDVPHGYRDNARALMDDDALADTLWPRAAEFLPPEMESQNAAGFNSKFRYYRYVGNESFAPHYDGCVRLGESISKLTFLVYLSEVPRGGETRFYDDDLQISHAIQPKLGSALVFEHAILHEGVAVQDGTKYVLRTDVMYA